MADCLTEKFGISLSWEYNFTNMQKKRLFSEFICSQYLREICSAIEEFAMENPDLFNLKVIDTVSRVECECVYPKKTWIRDLPALELEFDMAFEAELNFFEFSHRREEEEPVTQWFLVSGVADLKNGLTITEVQLYEKNYKAQSDYTDSLSPCIYEKDTERIAQRFLNEYFPETLEQGCAVDVDTVVRRMGLRVEKRHLSSDLHIFGQILFETSKTEVYDKHPMLEEFQAGTILIDDRVFFLRNYGSVRHTIIHECIHWYLHRKTFILAKLMKQAESGFKCCITGHMQSHEQSNDAWFLEWQANKIAAKVLVPEPVLKSLKFEGSMADSVKKVAAFFGVSIQVAKIRMIECGFNLAEGVFDYCDGRYLKPYAFRKDALKSDETYTIGCQDLIIEKMKNPELGSLMDKTQLVYTDSHLVVNCPKYVENKELTEYARMHLDECAIKFSVATKTGHNCTVSYRECILYRGFNGSVKAECRFEEEANKNTLSQAKAVLQHERHVNELLDCLIATSFTQTLINLMKKQGIKVEDLASSSRVSPRQITRLRTGETENPELETVIALAIGLDLPHIVSMEFLKIAGYTLRRTTSSHMMYDFFLSDCCILSVNECNQMLIAKGFEPLTGEEKAVKRK